MVQKLWFDLLEDRLQPNDMFGLGLSLLTGLSPAFSESSVEQPAALLHAPTTTALAVIQDTAAAVQPLVAAPNLANSGRGQLPTPAQASQAAELIQASQSYALLTDITKDFEQPTPGIQLVITSGATSADVDAFGRGTVFDTGAGDQLFESQYYFSSGGAVLQINATNCTVVLPLSLITPDHADSLVACGSTFFYFDQQVYGAAETWITLVYTFGTVNCLYSYNDYDVAGSTADEGSWQGGADYSQFIVRNNPTPDPHYGFGDYYTNPRPTHWQQGAYPTVRTQILSYTTGCGDLTDSTPVYGPGDWSGAIQYNLTGTYNVIVNAHFRNDTTSFP